MSAPEMSRGDREVLEIMKTYAAEVAGVEAGGYDFHRLDALGAAFAEKLKGRRVDVLDLSVFQLRSAEATFFYRGLPAVVALRPRVLWIAAVNPAGVFAGLLKGFEGVEEVRFPVWLGVPREMMVTRRLVVREMPWAAQAVVQHAAWV